jgi:hypothetical protein
MVIRTKRHLDDAVVHSESVRVLLVREQPILVFFGHCTRVHTSQQCEELACEGSIFEERIREGLVRNDGSHVRAGRRAANDESLLEVSRKLLGVACNLQGHGVA